MSGDCDLCGSYDHVETSCDAITPEHRFRLQVECAAGELRGEHRPQWSTPEMQARGKDPIGCEICWPQDGGWPCVSREIADDLDRAVAQVSQNGSDREARP